MNIFNKIHKSIPALTKQFAPSSSQSLKSFQTMRCFSTQYDNLKFENILFEKKEGGVGYV